MDTVESRLWTRVSCMSQPGTEPCRRGLRLLGVSDQSRSIEEEAGGGGGKSNKRLRDIGSKTKIIGSTGRLTVWCTEKRFKIKNQTNKTLWILVDGRKEKLRERNLKVRRWGTVEVTKKKKEGLGPEGVPRYESGNGEWRKGSKLGCW